MAGLGFFGGGLADAVNQGLTRNNQANFQQQELQIQQQGQQQAQQRFMMTQNLNLMTTVGAHLTDTISELKSVGEDPKIIQGKIQGMQDQLRALATSTGYKGYADAIVAAAMAAPSKTQVISAEAQARETPSVKAERTSQAAYRQYLMNPFGEPGAGTGVGTGGGTIPGGIGPNETVTGQTTEDLPPGAPLPIGGGPTTKTSPVASPSQPTPAQSGQPTVAQPNQTFQSGQGPTGDAYLSTLNPGVARAVKAVGDYEADAATVMARLPAPARIQFLGMVKEYNKDWKQQDYKAKSAAYGAFTNPNSTTSKSLRSFNVLTDHLDTLGQAADALKNKDLVTFNALKNAIATQTGEPAPNTFEGVRDIVGDELVKAIIGGGGALGDREAVKSRINAASSPKQLADLINNYKKLAGGQLTGLRKAYEEGTGRKDFDRFLLPAAKRQFEQGTSTKSTDQGATGKHPSSMSDDEIRKRLGL